MYGNASGMPVAGAPAAGGGGYCRLQHSIADMLIPGVSTM